TAAVHGAAGYHYEPVWRDLLAVNVSALHILLEYARAISPSLRVIYAGSSKIFPPPTCGLISETTPSQASCLYSVGTIAARELIAYYRKHHGIAATNLILFNHESARRPSQYLLPPLARAISVIRTEPRHRVTLKTLDFRVDWS